LAASWIVSRYEGLSYVGSVERMRRHASCDLNQVHPASSGAKPACRFVHLMLCVGQDGASTHPIPTARATDTFLVDDAQGLTPASPSRSGTIRFKKRAQAQ